MLTSILIGVLVDNQILDYNTKISEIWPEFGNNGKTEGTVVDLLRHELGLPFLTDTLIASDCSVEKIKENKIGAMLESESYHFTPGEKVCIFSVFRSSKYVNSYLQCLKCKLFLLERLSPPLQGTDR